jgi:hypothetical protein
MTEANQKQLGSTLWKIADDLRGAMNADDFRDYMLSFLFLRYLSDNYEAAAKKELGRDYPEAAGDTRQVPLALWYDQNAGDIPEFEKQMRRKVHYVIQPLHLWNSIATMARTQDGELLHTLQAGFKYIENESFESTFQGLFSEINLASDKLGKTYTERNAKLCTVIQKIAEGLADFSSDVDALGDAYEYLIGQFAAGAGKKAGEFYTPQQISDILSAIVTLDSQEPKTGPKKRLESVLDFACGSGSLLLNVRKRMRKTQGTIGKIYGQEKNITVYAQRTASTGRRARAAVFPACRVPRQPAVATAARRKSANSSSASTPAPCPGLSLSRQRAFASPRCADISKPNQPRPRAPLNAPGRPLFSNWNQHLSLRPPPHNAVTTDSSSRPVLFWIFRRASPPRRWPPSWRLLQKPPHDDCRRARHPRLCGARTGRYAQRLRRPPRPRRPPTPRGSPLGTSLCVYQHSAQPPQNPALGRYGSVGVRQALGEGAL